MPVINIETIGREPPAEIIEFGCADVHDTVDRPVARLYRLLGEIPPETLAVHHIAPQDSPRTRRSARPIVYGMAICASTLPDVIVAHNGTFEHLFVDTMHAERRL